MTRKQREQRGKNGLTAVLILLLIVGMCLLIGFKNSEEKRNYAYTETTTYYVERGDVLWNIAQLYSDNRHDVRKVVYEIEQLSKCTANIQPGDKLIIPVYEVMKNN